MYENNPNKYYSDAEIERVLVKTLSYLVSEWGIDIEATLKDNLKGSCLCYAPKNGKCKLVFGLPCLRSFMRTQDKFDRQANINWRGLNAVVSTAAHEYAHALVYDLDMDVRGIAHGYDWWHFYTRLLNDLIKEFTWD